MMLLVLLSANCKEKKASLTLHSIEICRSLVTSLLGQCAFYSLVGAFVCPSTKPVNSFVIFGKWNRNYSKIIQSKKSAFAVGRSVRSESVGLFFLFRFAFSKQTPFDKFDLVTARREKTHTQTQRTKKKMLFVSSFLCAFFFFFFLSSSSSCSIINRSSTFLFVHSLHDFYSKAKCISNPYFSLLFYLQSFCLRFCCAARRSIAIVEFQRAVWTCVCVCPLLKRVCGQYKRSMNANEKKSIEEIWTHENALQTLMLYIVIVEGKLCLWRRRSCFDLNIHTNT